jgi:hypothetical protein
MKNLVLVCLALLLFMPLGANAQDAISQLPVIVTQNAGVSGFQLPEISLTSSRLNPASLTNIARMRAKGMLSYTYGAITMARGDLSMNSLSLVNRIGGAYVGLNLYTSNSSPVWFLDTSALRGVESVHRLSATELTAGYAPSPKLSLGAGWIINEDLSQSLRSFRRNAALCDVTGKTSTNWRVGFQYRPTPAITLASVYGSRRDDYSFVNHPGLTGLSSDTLRSYSYWTGTFTAGVSAKVGKGTTLYYNHQFITTKGPAGSYRDIAYYGVQQIVNKNLSFKMVSNNGFPEVHLSYMNGRFLIGGYYCEGSKTVDDLVGKPKRLFLSVGTYF